MFERFLCTVLLVALLIGLPVSTLQSSELPDIGGVAYAPSPEDERRMGQAVMRNLRRAGVFIDDLLANDYINKLGYKLLSVHNQTEHEFHFFLINDKSINAFALPGGYIGVNYGLVLSSRSEDELAAVLAHEIAHVTQKHHSRAYAQSSNQIPVIAAIIAAALLGDAQVSQAAIASSLALQAEKQLSFTRANEREADRIGIALLAESGFNPRGMADFFKRLDDQSRLYGPQAPEFLRTHPVNVNRITDAQNRAGQLRPKIRKNNSQYYLLRSRLQVLGSDRPAEVLATYAQQQTAASPTLASRYGYLLALLENKKYSAARQVANKLNHGAQQSIMIKLANLQTELHIKPANALQQYQELQQYYPNHPAVIYDYAQALLRQNQATKAQQLLNQYLRKNPEQPAFFQLLAKTESLLGHPAASHQFQAEYYYQIGQLHQAIQQLELALKESNVDFYRLSQIEARQKELKDELKLVNELYKQ